MIPAAPRSIRRLEEPMSEVSAVTKDNFAAEVTEESGPVLVDFWAPWCRPCLAMAPVLEKLAQEMAGKLKVVKLNVDQSPDLATKQSIQSIPTLVVFKGGQELTRLPPHAISRRGVAYLPQTENVFENLSVRENIMMASYTLGSDETEVRVEECLQIFPVLNDYMKRDAKTLSGGERQMLAMVMALVRRPTVMMFDEPTGALSPKLAEEVLMKIVGLRETLGITIVLVEQHARRALEVGDKAYLMVSGRPIFEGQPEELMGHEELARLYLGIKK